LSGDQATDTTIIQKQIVEACLLSPLFKPVDIALTAAYPAATIPIDIKNAGVAIVCGSPALFAAQDALAADWVLHRNSDTAAWVRKNLGR